MFVKICGITSEEDALLCVAMGADALGFVFAAGSKRLVAIERVADIVRRLPPEVMTIGVFRNELPERVVELVGRAGLRGVQLHGSERPEQCAWIRERVEFAVKAFGAGDPAIERIGQYGVDAVHVDNPTPGSGEVFDWSLAEGVPTGTRLILAGGLTPANVGDAIASVRPWGVDVSTGVEQAPGVKDARKVHAFIDAARAAAAAFESPDDDLTAVVDRDAPYDWQADL